MTVIEKARHLRNLIEKSAQTLTDDEALTGVQLFPRWKVGVSYQQGQRLQYNSILYSVLQAHTSQEGWQPDKAPSLFAKVLIPDENIIPEWEQPDSTNGYKKGDRVIFEGKVYESLIDNNIWSPSAYPAGWKLIS